MLMELPSFISQTDHATKPVDEIKETTYTWKSNVVERV